MPAGRPRATVADGLLPGGGAFFVKRCVAVLVSGVWAFAFTWGMLWLINRATPVKVNAAAAQHGPNAELHGEAAYLDA